MPKTFTIQPRRVLKNGRWQYCVTTPKQMVADDKPRRRFFPDQSSAQAHADELMVSRGTLAGAVHRLSPQDQEVVLRLIARVNGDVRALERLVDLGVKQSMPRNAIGVVASLDEFYQSRVSDGVGEHMLRNYDALRSQLGHAFANEAVDKLTSPLLDDWLRTFENPVTRNSKRGILLTYLTWLQDREYLPDTLKWKLAIAIEPAREVEIFTPNELRGMLTRAMQPREKWKHTRESLVPFLVIGAFAGLRTSEIVRLDWSDIHLERDRKIISVRPTRTKQTKRRKGSHGRVVPILPNLIKWLRLFRKKSGHVVSHADVSDVVCRWPGWKKNALRHSFASYRVAVTQNEAQVATEIGDLVTTMKRHYKQAVDPKWGREWFGICPE